MLHSMRRRGKHYYLYQFPFKSMKQKLTKNILCPISYNVATIFDYFSSRNTVHDEYQSYLIWSCMPFVNCKFVVMLHRYWCDGRDKETFYDIIHSMQCIFIDVILRWIKILKIVHPYVSRERLGTQKWRISRKRKCVTNKTQESEQRLRSSYGNAWILVLLST